LERLNIKYQLLELGEIEINDGVPADVFAELQSSEQVLYFIVNNEKSADSKNKGYDCRNDL
jgi:hypothetical protein